MYIGFNSDILSPSQVTDYLIRVVQPRLQSVSGVQTAELIGSKTFALRAWLDPDRLAAYGLTASEVSAALSGNDYIAGLGTTKGEMVQVNLAASTSLHSLEEFRNLVVKQVNGANVKMKDVANVTLGSDDYEFLRIVQRQAGRLYRHSDRAHRKPARRHQRREGRLSRDREGVARGPHERDRL